MVLAVNATHLCFESVVGHKNARNESMSVISVNVAYSNGRGQTSPVTLCY